MVIRIKQATKQGYIDMIPGGLADLSYPNSKTRRGRVQGGGVICPTLTTSGEVYQIMSKYEVRKISALEYWRLMGFSDEDFHKAEKVNSNTQLIKQAGNSIVKNVLIEALRPIIEQ